MNFSVIFLELILPLDAKAFDELVDNAYSKTKKKKIVETEYGFSDEVLFSHGIGIAYLGHNKKRKIKLIIHPGMVIDNNSVDDHWEVTSSKISKFIRKLSLHINDYFDSEYELDDFALGRIDFVADVDVGNRETASDYIKILHNIGKVKCFSSVKREKRGNVKGNSFELKGKSNGLEFKAHRLEKEKNILRFEIRLIKRDAIRACSDEAATENVIEDVFNIKCTPCQVHFFEYVLKSCCANNSCLIIKFSSVSQIVETMGGRRPSSVSTICGRLRRPMPPLYYRTKSGSFIMVP